MAENPASKELQSLQQSTLQAQQSTLQNIQTVLVAANFPEEAANERKALREQLLAQQQGNQIAQDTEKAHQKRHFDESKHKRDAQGHFIKNQNWLQKILGVGQAMFNFSKENAKKALELASRLKIDDVAKNMADKAGKFAKNLLDLLVKGLGLAALWMLLDWISKQDWQALYEKHKEDILKFWDALKLVGATVAGWAGALWLIDGPVFKLWRNLVKLFGEGGKFSLLVTKVIGWSGSLIFDLAKGSLGLLWTAIKAVFGGLGKFAGLMDTVTKWAGHAMFDIGKGSLGLLWTALKTVFAVGGTIAVLADDIQAKWTGHKMFGPDGAIRTAWQRLVGIFGDGKDAMGKKFLTWADTLKDFMGFGPDGSFQKMWKGIKGFFGIGGKIATSPGFLLTAEEMVDLKHIGLDDKGPFKSMWKAITGMFGPEGKIANGWRKLQQFEDWVGEKSDIQSMFNGLKKIFGKEGKIGKGWATAKATFGNFFGPESPIDNVMKSFNTMFGPESTIGKFLKTSDDAPSGPGFIQRIKTIFSAEGAVGKLFGIFSGIGDTIGGVATKIMDSKPVQIMKKIFGLVFKAGGAAVAAGGTILATVGKIFAPLGWIMAIFEGVSGFIEGFKDKGTDDTRTMGQKISDGLKGAIDALVNFFVVDLLQLIEDVINWGIRKLNDFLPSWMGGGSLKEISFAEGVGDAIKGVTDAAVDAVTGGDDLSPEERKEREKLLRESAARKMMFGLGVGKYDEGFFSDDVDIDSKNLASKLKGMNAEQIGRLQKAMEVASKGKAGFDVSGEDWRKEFAKELNTRSAEERQLATTAMISPIQINNNNSSAPTNNVGGGQGENKHDNLREK